MREKMTKVLVVEDNPLSLELVLEILKLQEFTADWAENGEEAINKTVFHKTEKDVYVYDLILMDIELPGIDGIEAARIIKGKPAYKNVPVIALTSYAMKGDKERFIADGFDEYISKPINITEFIKRLEKYRIGGI